MEVCTNAIYRQEKLNGNDLLAAPSQLIQNLSFGLKCMHWTLGAKLEHAKSNTPPKINTTKSCTIIKYILILGMFTTSTYHSCLGLGPIY